MSEGVCLKCGAEMPFDWAPCPQCGWKAPDAWEVSEEEERNAPPRGLLIKPNNWIRWVAWLLLIPLMVLLLSTLIRL